MYLTMFQKVIFSDDYGSVNEGVKSVLTNLSIQEIEGVQYCDDAYVRIKAAFKSNTPYDLFITDLSFEPDHRNQQFESGEVLIKKLKEEHPELMIIVYSMEDRLQKVRLLVNEYGAKGYVVKGRNGLSELTQAIQDVSKHRPYLSPKIRGALMERVDLALKSYELKLIDLLAEGLTQKEISERLKVTKVSPSSISSVEKKLHRLREQFNADNNVQLITIIKDLGLL